MWNGAASASSSAAGAGMTGRGGHQRVLRVPAVRQRGRADDPVAGGEAGRLRARLDHLTAQLGAGGERQRRADLVGALAHQHVGEVGDGGEDPDQELSRARDRGGHLGQLEDVDRVAVPGDLPGFHAFSFSSIRRCSRFMPRSHLSVSVARSA